MRQLTMTESRDLEWRDVADPSLEAPGQALVRPMAVALCDLDQPIIRGQAPIPGPIALGHECVAEVMEVGDEVSGVSVGDVVSVPFQISCGDCGFCRRGLTGSCETVPPRSMYGFGVFGGDWGGALSDALRVPYADAMLVPVPDGLDPVSVASVSDNVVDGWRTVAPGLADRPGAPVLIVGGGARSVALYAVDAALALGAERVTYLDHDPSRLGVAEELGAETIDGPPPRSHGSYPITVDASATVEGLHCALRSTEPGGRCTSVGIIYEPETPLPLLEMYTEGVHFHIARAMARADMPRVLELTAAGKLRPERVTSQVAGWDDAIEAIAEPQTKLVISR
jgi:alcohol dehydrogenase